MLTIHYVSTVGLAVAAAGLCKVFFAPSGAQEITMSVCLDLSRDTEFILDDLGLHFTLDSQHHTNC